MPSCIARTPSQSPSRHNRHVSCMHLVGRQETVHDELVNVVQVPVQRVFSKQLFLNFEKGELVQKRVLDFSKVSLHYRRLYHTFCDSSREC